MYKESDHVHCPGLIPRKTRASWSPSRLMIIIMIKICKDKTVWCSYEWCDVPVSQLQPSRPSPGQKLTSFFAVFPFIGQSWPGHSLQVWWLRQDWWSKQLLLAGQCSPSQCWLQQLIRPCRSLPVIYSLDRAGHTWLDILGTTEEFPPPTNFQPDQLTYISSVAVQSKCTCPVGFHYWECKWRMMMENIHQWVGVSLWR